MIQNNRELTDKQYLTTIISVIIGVIIVVNILAFIF